MKQQTLTLLTVEVSPINKVCVLIPCLMRDNNRKANIKYITDNISKTQADKFVIYAQCFTDNDYATLTHLNVEFIGRVTEPQGFVKPRNELLKWFYRSDFDYAIWLDANETMTNTTLNSFLTLVDAVRNDKVDFDAVFSSLGIIASSERIQLASMDDYFDVLKLLPTTRYSVKNSPWLHSCFMKNLRKYYDEELYIDERCDPWKGTSEDTYFSTLLRQCCRCYLCPSITISKPPAKTSTWMHNSTDENGKPTYGYPPIAWEEIQTMATENSKERIRGGATSIIEIPRVDDFRSNLTSYKSRKKIPDISQKVSLF